VGKVAWEKQKSKWRHRFHPRGKFERGRMRLRVAAEKKRLGIPNNGGKAHTGGGGLESQPRGP